MKKIMLALLFVVSALGFSTTEVEIKNIEMRKGISYYNDEIMNGEYLLKAETTKATKKS